MTEALYDFTDKCFSGRDVVFAVAEDLVITAVSGGVPVGTGPHALLATATGWYMTRLAALLNSEADAAPQADEAALQSAARTALATALA